MYILYYWIQIMNALMYKGRLNVAAGKGGGHLDYFIYCWVV